MGTVVKISMLLARPGRALEIFLESFFLSTYYLGTTDIHSKKLNVKSNHKGK